MLKPKTPFRHTHPNLSRYLYPCCPPMHNLMPRRVPTLSSHTRCNLRWAGLLLLRCSWNEAGSSNDRRNANSEPTAVINLCYHAKDSPGYLIYHVWCSWQEIKNTMPVRRWHILIYKWGLSKLAKTAACTSQGLFSEPGHCQPHPLTSFHIPSEDRGSYYPI